MDKEMFERLEGLHSIDGVKNMLAHFEYVVRDIQEHEPFEVEDIIKFYAHDQDIANKILKDGHLMVNGKLQTLKNAIIDIINYENF